MYHLERETVSIPNDLGFVLGKRAKEARNYLGGDRVTIGESWAIT